MSEKADRPGSTFYYRGPYTHIQFICEHCGEKVDFKQPTAYPMFPSSIFCPHCGAQTTVPTPFQEIGNYGEVFACRRCGKPAKWRGALCSECYRRYKFGKYR